MLGLIIPEMKSGFTASGVSSSDLSVSDVRELQKRLREIEPELRKQLVRDVKAAGKPTADAIKSRLASVTPVSGMRRGRLAWDHSVDGKGRIHKATDVKVQFRTSTSGRSLTTTLLRVGAFSPAVVMLDMAGRSGRYIDAGYKGSGYTRPYAYKGGTRRHKVNGQGRALIARSGGSASRFVWPSALATIPQATVQVDRILRNAYATIGKKYF